jgi:hypothetical protein
MAHRICTASFGPHPRRRGGAGEAPQACACVSVLRAWHGDDGMEVIRDVTAADRSVTPSPGIRTVSEVTSKLRGPCALSPPSGGVRGGAPLLLSTTVTTEARTAHITPHRRLSALVRLDPDLGVEGGIVPERQFWVSDRPWTPAWHHPARSSAASADRLRTGTTRSEETCRRTMCGVSAIVLAQGAG